MSHFYRNSPVSGFTGHVPGARFTVGRRALKTPGREDRERARGERETSKDTNGHSISSEELLPRAPLSRSEFALNQIHHQPDYHGTSELDYYLAAMNQGQGGGGAPPQGYQFPNGQPIMYPPGMGYPGIGASYGSIPAAYQDSLNYTIGYNAHAMPMRVPRDPTEYEYYQGEPGGQQNQQQAMRYGDAGEAFSSTHDYAAAGGRTVQQQQPRGVASAAAGAEMKRRSQSMPRRRPDGAPPLKDPFEGLDGGVYSKGEVLRNKERRMLAMRGEPVTGKLYHGNGSGSGGGGERIANFGLEGGDELSEEDRARRAAQMEEENDRIPAAGYSGHIPRFRRIGVGKSFNTAAREAKKEFIEDKLSRTSDGSDFDLSRSSLRPSRLEGHQKFDASTGRPIDNSGRPIDNGSAPANDPPAASNNSSASHKPPLGNNFTYGGSTNAQQQPAPDDPQHQIQNQQLPYGYPIPYILRSPLSPGSGSAVTIPPYAYPQPMYMPYVYAQQPPPQPQTQPQAAPPAAPSASGRTSGGRFGSGLAGAERAPFRDDASSIEQLGASVGKVVVSQDGLFANSLIRRPDGSLLDITPPGIVKEEEIKDEQKSVTYEAQTPFGEPIRAMRGN